MLFRSYKLGTRTTLKVSLRVDLETMTRLGVWNFEVTPSGTGLTMTLPDTVRWAGPEPSWNPGSKYQVTIIEGLATAISDSDDDILEYVERVVSTELEPLGANPTPKIVDMTGDPGTAYSLTAGLWYDFGLRGTLEISLAEPTQSERVSEWCFQFTSGTVPTTLILPGSLKIGRAHV